jgi:hypothetical protein
VLIYIFKVAASFNYLNSFKKDGFLLTRKVAAYKVN